jgi:hypothetical protein
MKRSNIDVVKEISMCKFILSSIHNLSFKGVDHRGEERRRRWGGGRDCRLSRWFKSFEVWQKTAPTNSPQASYLLNHRTVAPRTLAVILVKMLHYTFWIANFKFSPSRGWTNSSRSLLVGFQGMEPAFRIKPHQGWRLYDGYGHITVDIWIFIIRATAKFARTSIDLHHSMTPFAVPLCMDSYLSIIYVCS